MIFKALLIISSTLFAADPTADEILAKAENIRNPSEDYTCSVSLVDFKDAKPKEERTFESSIKGREKALVRYLTPVIEKDTRVLMVGQDMWVQTKGSAKAIRISANQKLTGNAAYGDVARLSFLGNYKATLNRKMNTEGKDVFVLDLESLPGRPVTYDKVEYWVDTKSYRPVRTIFKTFSNKVIREGSYDDYQDVFGVQRPTTFMLTNVLQKEHTTTLKFSNTKKAKLSDLLFEKQNLGR